MKVSIIFTEELLIDNSTGQQQVKITNPSITFKVPFVPTALSLGIAIVISQFDIESEHQIDVSIIDPEKPDDPLFSPPTQKIPGGQQGVNLIISLVIRNIPFMHAGEYVVHAIIDGQLHTEEFYIDGEKLPQDNER